MEFEDGLHPPPHASLCRQGRDRDGCGEAPFEVGSPARCPGGRGKAGRTPSCGGRGAQQEGAKLFPRPEGGGGKKGRSENLCLGSLSAPGGGVSPLGSEAGRHTSAEPSFRRLVAEGVKLLKARLFATDLMGASPKEFADPSDPTGFRCFKEGYVVWGKYVDKYLKSGARYRKGLWARLRRMVTARFGSAAATEEGKYGSKAPSGTLFPRSWGKPQPS